MVSGRARPRARLHTTASSITTANCKLMYYNSARDHLSAEANSNRLQPSMPWSSGRVVRRVKEGATTPKTRVRGPQFQPGSTDERLAGPSQHHGNSLVHFISISDKLPRLSMHVDEDPKSRLGSTNYRLAGPCPHKGKSLISLYVNWWRTSATLNACVGGSQSQLVSINYRLSGPCPHKGISLISLYVNWWRTSATLDACVGGFQA